MRLPALWLVSDARTDVPPGEGLAAALRALPRGSGLIFRHYHLRPDERARCFARIAQLCRQRGVLAIWAGDPGQAARLAAAGSYGPPARSRRGAGNGAGHSPSRAIRLATVHSLAELGAAHRTHADAVLLSPAFPTRSHPGASTLGPLRWRLIAARALVPVIALGGMTARRARRLGTTRWAAIDGLAPTLRQPTLHKPTLRDRKTARFPKDS